MNKRSKYDDSSRLKPFFLFFPYRRGGGDTSAVGVSAKWVFDSGLWQRESADQKCQFGTGLCPALAAKVKKSLKENEDTKGLFPHVRPTNRPKTCFK